ncbi:MAG: hypothetical protein JWM80_593 [Cyanobacteria bacterium RYN_339]|nr:hypothetical protein [Cyanobacteria bacterium RYN_339]
MLTRFDNCLDISVSQPQFPLTLTTQNANMDAAMHVIAKQKLRDFYRAHPQAKLQLEVWWKVAKQAKWTELVEVQRTFKSAEAVGRFTVFNICGNKYRLIVDVKYGWGRIYVRHVLTHAEYDKGKWKNDPHF